MIKIKSYFFNFQSQSLITIALGAIPYILHQTSIPLDNVKSACNSYGHKFGSRSSQSNWVQLVLVQVKLDSVKNTY